MLLNWSYGHNGFCLLFLIIPPWIWLCRILLGWENKACCKPLVMYHRGVQMHYHWDAALCPSCMTGLWLVWSEDLQDQDIRYPFGRSILNFHAVLSILITKTEHILQRRLYIRNLVSATPRGSGITWCGDGLFSWWFWYELSHWYAKLLSTWIYTTLLDLMCFYFIFIF